MAYKLAHLREKAVMLRTQKNLTLDEIVERLSLPKTTVYYWIKDIPIPRTEKQTAAQQRRADNTRVRYAALRDAAYQQGWDEAPGLLQDPSFRDFVVLYMAEGYKRNRNVVSFVNSDKDMIKLAHRWIVQFTAQKLEYHLQYHVDHDVDELKQYWGDLLAIDPTDIRLIRKSNSGELSGRQFRSVYGVFTVRTSDTYFRSKLQAWMDYVKAQW
jgi:hypothetical protein